MFVTHAWLLASDLALANRRPFQWRIRFPKNALTVWMGTHGVKSGS